MNETLRLALAYPVLIFLPVFTLVLFIIRRPWNEWLYRHSFLEQRALEVLAIWPFMLVMIGLLFFSFGKKVIPYLTLLCTTTGGLLLVRIQYRFKKGKIAKFAARLTTDFYFIKGQITKVSPQNATAFDERDYRIGQEALQTAYLTFWKLFMVVGVFLYLFVTPFKLEIPSWALMLVFPAMALIVSLVHAVTILRLCRKDAECETVDG